MFSRQDIIEISKKLKYISCKDTSFDRVAATNLEDIIPIVREDNASQPINYIISVGDLLNSIKVSHPEIIQTIPVGGSSGMVLAKRSSGDYDFIWTRRPGSVFSSSEGGFAEVFNTATHIYSDVLAGKSSHAEGDGSYAGGIASHAEGLACRTHASYCHAGGNTSVCNEEGGFAHGYALINNAPYQGILGKFNEASSSDAFQIGWGSSNSARKNLFSINQNGKISILDKDGQPKILQDLIGSTYTLPTASPTVLGGIKVGKGLSISDGVLSLDSSLNYLRLKGIVSTEASLPTIGNEIGDIYLVGPIEGGSQGNIYKEYVWTSLLQWEQFGKIDINFDPNAYYTKEEINTYREDFLYLKSIEANLSTLEDSLDEFKAVLINPTSTSIKGDLLSCIAAGGRASNTIKFVVDSDNYHAMLFTNPSEPEGILGAIVWEPTDQDTFYVWNGYTYIPNFEVPSNIDTALASIRSSNNYKQLITIKDVPLSISPILRDVTGEASIVNVVLASNMRDVRIIARNDQSIVVQLPPVSNWNILYKSFNITISGKVTNVTFVKGTGATIYMDTVQVPSLETSSSYRLLYTVYGEKLYPTDSVMDMYIRKTLAKSI